MFKKLLYILPVFLFLLVLSPVSTYAASADYDGATFYYQLPDGRRLMTENRLSWGTKPIYLVSESDGFRFVSDGNLYVVSPDGSYTTASGSYDSSYTSNGKTWTSSRSFTYPANFYGTTIDNFTELEQLSGASGVGVYRLYESTNYEDATDFFRNPLLEEVKVQQKGTVAVTTKLVSYLNFLIPCGIGLLALLTALPVLLRGLRTFLR